ncbi:hypothetical protein RUM44_010492 [Polyplax serrata]|uniref:Uncharacterized protein n=1 Tax=Polyplax serrata TaxID=468196 RepID=A0ABR1AVR2_POLSC
MLCGTILFKWILLFITAAIVRGKQQQSELCEAVDKSCRKKSPDECQMKYYKLNSTGCRDLTFSYNSVTTEGNIGTVKIETYHYNWLSYKQTGFNVSFGDIVWSRMKFRFKQEGNELKNTCREFYMSENSTLKSFFYDCLWSNEGYEGKTFNFEYEMSTSQVSLYKKYTFRVPLSKNIEETTDLKNWEIFLFTEMFTNVFGLTTIILHWQPVPSRFSTNLYSVTVFSNDSGHPEVLFSTDVTCHSVEDCKFNYNKWHGSVQFGVQPLSLSNKSDFYMSKTIVFHLGE